MLGLRVLWHSVRPSSDPRQVAKAISQRLDMPIFQVQIHLMQMHPSTTAFRHGTSQNLHLLKPDHAQACRCG